MSDDLSIPNPSYRGNRTGRYNRTAPQRRPGMDADTRRLMLFAGGVGGVLAMLIAASAMTGRHAGQIPVVMASTDPIRVKPENPGGLRIDAAESDIFSGGGDTQNARLGPASETPDTRALQSPERSAIAPAVPMDGAVAGDGKPDVTKQATARQAAAPALPLTAKAAAPGKAAPPDSHAASGTRPVMVQLAAMTTEAGANEEWQRLTKRYAELFAGRTLTIAKSERDGRTFWRVRTGGFGDIAQARAFCDKLRGKSSGCSVVEF